ncbi:MAG: pyruvate dehydrogenase (acetyl-transferring) E1 component subunit alpha [Chloroflexi bacterium]|nr:pyruvate dehydrogenase (acetyl-transferring) E1 component subunit alpha [Chloroflexota bacterium]
MDRTELMDLYRQMVLIRRIEERSSELYAQGKIGGFLHLYIGQEAVCVGAISALRLDDHVITAYRDHGQALALNLDPKAIMAELLGKVTGVSKGKGGSMHLADVGKHFWGGYAIVGGHLPLATGLGLAAKYREEDWCVLCFLGDGSTNIGYFHESLNLAAVWKLPVVFLCENNKYGMGTEVSRASAVTEMIQKASAYCIPASQVDGMDVLAVREATANAAAHARSGQGPYFLEAITYRFRGHSMGDPERYRKPEEIEEWRKKDPIGKFQKQLLDEKSAELVEFESIEAHVETEVADAIAFAEASPFPPPEALFEDIYVNP